MVYFVLLRMHTVELPYYYFLAHTRARIFTIAHFYVRDTPMNANQEKRTFFLLENTSFVRVQRKPRACGATRECKKEHIVRKFGGRLNIRTSTNHRRFVSILIYLGFSVVYLFSVSQLPFPESINS